MSTFTMGKDELPEVLVFGQEDSLLADGESNDVDIDGAGRDPGDGKDIVAA